MATSDYRWLDARQIKAPAHHPHSTHPPTHHTPTPPTSILTHIWVTLPLRHEIPCQPGPPVVSAPQPRLIQGSVSFLQEARTVSPLSKAALNSSSSALSRSKAGSGHDSERVF
jgi:hypothetical protein